MAGRREDGDKLFNPAIRTLPRSGQGGPASSGARFSSNRRHGPLDIMSSSCPVTACSAADQACKRVVQHSSTWPSLPYQLERGAVLPFHSPLAQRKTSPLAHYARVCGTVRCSREAGEVAATVVPFQDHYEMVAMHSVPRAREIQTIPYPIMSPKCSEPLRLFLRANIFLIPLTSPPTRRPP